MIQPFIQLFFFKTPKLLTHEVYQTAERGIIARRERCKRGVEIAKKTQRKEAC